MDELKPCPFCGATAEINKHYPPFQRRVKVTVRCMKCRCNSGEWGRTDKAIEAWNRRVEPVTSPLLTEKWKRQHRGGAKE